MRPPIWVKSVVNCSTAPRSAARIGSPASSRFLTALRSPLSLTRFAVATSTSEAAPEALAERATSESATTPTASSYVVSASSGEAGSRASKAATVSGGTSEVTVTTGPERDAGHDRGAGEDAGTGSRRSRSTGGGGGHGQKCNPRHPLTVNTFGHKTTDTKIHVTADTGGNRCTPRSASRPSPPSWPRSARLSVSDLAEKFGVTTETIRRDLSTLERSGLVRRVHGGVVASQALSVLEVAVSDRDRSSAAEKDRIAAAALDLVPENGSIVLDAGTTTARLAGALPTDRRVEVITHAVPIAARLAGNPAIVLRLLPGRVRTTTHAAVGEDTVAALEPLLADVVFLGTNGISAAHGLSTPDHSEAAVKRAIVAAGRQVVLLADSDKLGQEHLVRFARLDQVDVIVTDDRATPDQITPLTDAGIKVVLA